MSKSKRGPASVPAQSIRAGTQLPPEVAAMVTLAVFVRRKGDDATGQYDEMTVDVMLQADCDDHMMERLEAGQGQLQAAIESFTQALTKVLGGEIIGRAPMPTIGGRRIGRA